LIQSRFYNVNGVKWEARFFRKGETLPDTNIEAPRQGIWAKPADSGWEHAAFVGHSWASVQFDPDLLYFPEKK